MHIVRQQSFKKRKKKASGHSEKLSPKKKEYVLKNTF